MYIKKEVKYKDRESHARYNRTISMRVSEEQLNALKDIAERQQKKYQAILKDLIEKYIKENE